MSGVNQASIFIAHKRASANRWTDMLANGIESRQQQATDTEGSDEEAFEETEETE